MKMFHRLTMIVRCWFTDECPRDLPTHDETIRLLREQEIAAKSATREISERIRVRERAAATIHTMMADVSDTWNNKGGR